MKIQSPDPDMFIRQNVFQPIVDRFGIDPRSASRTLHRLGVIGSVGGVGGLMWALVPIAIRVELPLWNLILFAVMISTSLAMQAHQLLSPPVFSMAPKFALARMMWLVICGILALIALMLPAATPTAIRVSTTVFAIGWILGVCALYVHLCRKPPRRPKREAVVGRKLARA